MSSHFGHIPMDSVFLAPTNIPDIKVPCMQARLVDFLHDSNWEPDTVLIFEFLRAGCSRSTGPSMIPMEIFLLPLSQPH